MHALRVLAALVSSVVLAATSASPAAASEPGRGDPDYLALGDSVAFGLNPLLDFQNAASFVGYPESLARRLDLNLNNASCPGETSDGLISHTNPQLDNGCNPYRANFLLHTRYSGSQLDFAVAYLLAHPRTRLVTIDVGANDLFLLQ